MKTDNELLLMGLRSLKSETIGKLNKCINKWADETGERDLTVNDLNTLSNDIAVYRAELAEVEGRILKLSPQFAADDIPF